MSDLLNKSDLIHKLNSLNGITNDERAYLINLVNTKKKYGLVWEDKTEVVEELLRENLPVLREVAEKRILSKDLPSPEKKERTLFDGEETNEMPNPPNHILIEGDNLHALTALTFTHEGKIDVMYFDPPYNTGNKDFKYNDCFVDREDSYRHSKWLNFMNKRLKIAKRLLSDHGVLFISIDDNEHSQLKLLCDEIFGESQFVGDVIWQHSIQGKNDAKTISLHHNYTLIYSGSNFQINKVQRVEANNRAYSNPDNDINGPWRSGDVRSPNFRENLRYTIKTPSGKSIEPPANGWRWEENKLISKIESGEIIFNKSESKIIRKIYLNNQGGRVPESIWFGAEVGTTRDATALLKEIFNETPFDTPKPIELIIRILQIGGLKNATILDIFAGSGTTLHATMSLNSQDGGIRQCILATNNENNICEDVTYVRNQRVIQGYTNSKGETVPGLTNNNLRYYKCDFVPREPSLKNKRELTKSATNLLSLRENCYIDCTSQFISENQSWIKLFSDDISQFLCIVYDDEVVEEAVVILKQLIDERKPVLPIKVYVFSNGQYPYTEEFEDVLPYITLCALPDAIYKAYQNVLPSQKRTRIIEFEDINGESASKSPQVFVENDLFNQEG
ncbi:MAG: site-specific DNA-methyltransferase [Alphaproteobacteria bacterium]|nr:site-specific DNA-methyltransferase [Alphaproteobacteria bacterium]